MYNMLDHELSGDEDWDLPFLPNPGIHDSGETSEGEGSESGSGEGPAMLQSNYVDLHALHEYKDGRRCCSATSEGVGILSMSRLSLKGGAAASQGGRVQMNLRSVINANVRCEGGGS
jgi:hypothetical protein